MRPTRRYVALVFFILFSLGCKTITDFGNFPEPLPDNPSTVTPSSVSITEIPTPRYVVGDTVTSRKDGAVLVYVPAGKFMMGGKIEDALDECGKFRSECTPSDFEDEQPAHEVDLSAFWLDQTEVTNAMYEKCVDAGICEIADFLENKSYTHPNYFGNPEYANYPFLNGNWKYAKTYCEWAGRRLPTEAEWEKAARGPNATIYPWGNEFDGAALNFCDGNCPVDTADTNYDDGYGDVSPVGSYPQGKSFYGALDMAGNVREWVSDWYDPAYYSISPLKDPTGPETGTFRVMRGGSWVNWGDEARTTRRYADVAGQHYTSVGFRCAVSEEDFVIDDSAPAAPNLPIKTMLSEQDGATLVYVPAGEFLMGSTEAQINAIMDECNQGEYTNYCAPEYFVDELPQRSVSLDAFWIDQTEVTNAQYNACVAAGACPELFDNESNFAAQSVQNFPVIFVQEASAAEAYCAWAGRRLPTEAEWEKAARGTDGRIYPWGNQAPNDSLLNFNMNTGGAYGTSEAGYYPNGASPYGAYDMAGGVQEWVADWYDPNFYSTAPLSNPFNSEPAERNIDVPFPNHVLRGGGTQTPVYWVRSADRVYTYSGDAYFYADVGFRCAMSDSSSGQPSPSGVNHGQSCESGVTLTSTETKNGLELTVCSLGEEYTIPGLAKGSYSLGPNNKFFIYATNGGDIYAARVGDVILHVLGNVKDFYIIQRGEIPKYRFLFNEANPYEVTIEVVTSGERRIFSIPKYIAAP